MKQKQRRKQTNDIKKKNEKQNKNEGGQQIQELTDHCSYFE